jgi:Icc-related predicted phosphoesterase
MLIWWCCVIVIHRIQRLFVKPKFTFIDYLTKTSRRVSILPPRPTVPHRRIICISDTHTLHTKLTIPEGDILVHCGDILLLNEENLNLCINTSPPALLNSFNTWLGEQPVKARVVIAGNHDLFCQVSGSDQISQILSNAVYLENTSATVEGIRFFGIPISPHGNRTYNAWQYPEYELKRFMESLIEKSSDMPTVDILVTHAKPFGSLEDFVKEKNPKFILSGHHHHRYGVGFSEQGVFINCATLNSLYMPFHPPVVFDYIL